MTSIFWFQFLAVAIGGAFGAVIRFVLTFANPSLAWPIGTLLANWMGAFGIGFFGALWIYNVPVWNIFSLKIPLNSFVITGILGGLTTFSTLIFEIFLFLQQGRFSTAALYVFFTWIGGLALCTLGWWIVRS
ncbi:MAG: CrcB family protein [Pseudomonadota bacterium]